MTSDIYYHGLINLWEQSIEKQICCSSFLNNIQSRVRTGPGNPGKSLNLKNKNPDLESPGILLKVLESPGILNSEKRVCKNGIC